MAWIRVDDHFDEHPKMQRVGPLAWGFWLAGLAYCNRNLTDGFIPWNKARTLCSFEVVEEDGQVWELTRASSIAGEDVAADWLVGLLIEVGLWDEVTNDKGRIEGYRVHDYGEYQPSKEQVEASRSANAERQARWRERNAESNGVTNGASNAPRNGHVTTPPNPNPYPIPVPDTKPKPRRVKATKEPEYTPAFLAFWGQYPKKVGKSDAFEVWMRINPTPELVEEIMAALAWQRLEWTDPRYTPHPTTYLNGRRWEDERPSGEIKWSSVDRSKLTVTERNMQNSVKAKELLRRMEQESVYGGVYETAGEVVR